MHAAGEPGQGRTRMDGAIRVGAVKYLNTKPLICDLERLAPARGAGARRAQPSGRPARRRRARRRPDSRDRVFPRPAATPSCRTSSIASRGPVLSVTLFSRVPWAEIRRVALDEGSRTSAALTQILLRKRYGVHPEIVPLPMDRAAEDVDADAVLLIGDRAMRACLPGFRYAFDLGQEWFDWTGLPFVYAVWAVRGGRRSRAGRAGACTRRSGAAWPRVGAIAQREAPRLGLDAGFCRRYLEQHHPLRPGAARTGGAAPLLHAGLRAGAGPRGG